MMGKLLALKVLGGFSQDYDHARIPQRSNFCFEVFTFLPSNRAGSIGRPVQVYMSPHPVAFHPGAHFL